MDFARSISSVGNGDRIFHRRRNGYIAAAIVYFVYFEAGVEISNNCHRFPRASLPTVDGKQSLLLEIVGERAKQHERAIPRVISNKLCTGVEDCERVKKQRVRFEALLECVRVISESSKITATPGLLAGFACM